MDAKKIVNGTQEQAVASWINYLNQLRLDKLMESLHFEEVNLESAMQTINRTLTTIRDDIVNNGKGRGGENGMHGFIAEVAECGIGNAREQIEGRTPVYEWINDNGPEDLKRAGVLIQQKFVQSGGHLSLRAVQMHLEKYPDFLANGGKYQIPADHYDKIKWLLSISQEDANKMPTSSGEFSLRQWKEVQEFFNSGVVPFDSLEPSILDYKAVQKNAYEGTIENEKVSLKARNEERREAAYNESKPTIQEGLKATAAAALIEGGMDFCLSISAKRKTGKRIRDFDERDWTEIAKDSVFGTVKGGIRGISLYGLTNFTATPAAVANAIVTASFGVADQANKYRNGKINETEFLENSELLCLDASVSALSSFAGQVIIPVPILGAIIGNAVGTMMYQIAKDNLSSKEQKIISEYLNSIGELEDSLAREYQEYVDAIASDMQLYIDLLDKAFAPDIRIAFSGSIELAKAVGVPQEEILDSYEKVASYFLD